MFTRRKKGSKVELGEEGLGRMKHSVNGRQSLRFPFGFLVPRGRSTLWGKHKQEQPLARAVRDEKKKTKLQVIMQADLI